MRDMTIRVDWTHCDGRGLCAELVPEIIQMDEWGYPVVTVARVPRRLVRHARRAAASCPMLALHVDEA